MIWQQDHEQHVMYIYTETHWKSGWQYVCRQKVGYITLLNCAKNLKLTYQQDNPIFHVPRMQHTLLQIWLRLSKTCFSHFARISTRPHFRAEDKSSMCRPHALHARRTRFHAYPPHGWALPVINKKTAWNNSWAQPVMSPKENKIKNPISMYLNTLRSYYLLVIYKPVFWLFIHLSMK